jgi:dTDP-4-dehydrorhamnose 3,5-epimerase
MPVFPDKAEYEWIWVPIGFAHGNFFTENTVIEYYCTGEYNPACEAGISPLAEDIDWSLVEPCTRELFLNLAPHSSRISAKDRNGLTLAQWQSDNRSRNFIYHK